MTWLKSPFTRYERGDFILIIIGGVAIFWSLPAFVMLLIDVDPGARGLAMPLLVLFGIGNILGLGFILLGLRLCSYPGSLTYRITHGQISR